MVEVVNSFTGATVWEAEGARVGLVTCLTCGASVMLDPRYTVTPLKIHFDWHKAMTPGASS